MGRIRRSVVATAKSRALGGIAAQGSQAFASFALQIAAVRALDLAGFGRFTVLYGFIVLATAIASGVVGDPATVLDRHDRRIRAGLQFWWVITGLAAGIALLVATAAAGYLDLRAAAAFALAAAAFLWEDTLRRLLMANFAFWRIVAVDITGLLGALAALGVVWSANGRIDLWHLLLALAVGQLLAAVLAVPLIPAHDRYLVPPRPADLRTVIGYGSWRTAYRSLRPATASLILVACGAVVSLAAVGELGITRTYMAPAALVVAGVTSFLFAEYASRRDDRLADLMRVADGNALVLLTAVTLMGAAAVALLPVLGPLITGDDRELSAVMVAGWAAFSAAVAMGSPYSELASVRGRLVLVLVLRSVEAVASVAAAVAVAALLDATTWVPATMAATTVLMSLVIRQRVLIPMTRVASAVT